MSRKWRMGDRFLFNEKVENKGYVGVRGTVVESAPGDRFIRILIDSPIRKGAPVSFAITNGPSISYLGVRVNPAGLLEKWREENRKRPW